MTQASSCTIEQAQKELWLERLPAVIIPISLPPILLRAGFVINDLGHRCGPVDSPK